MTESKGPESSIGDLCYIHETSGGRKIPAEVVGFHEQHVLLMPFSSMAHIAPGCLVEATGKPLEVYVGDALIGTVLDPIGRPLDGSALPLGLKPVSVERDPPNPLARPPIAEPLEVGCALSTACWQSARVSALAFLPARCRQEHAYGNDRPPYVG